MSFIIVGGRYFSRWINMGKAWGFSSLISRPTKISTWAISRSGWSLKCASWVVAITCLLCQEWVWRKPMAWSNVSRPTTRLNLHVFHDILIHQSFPWSFYSSLVPKFNCWEETTQVLKHLKFSGVVIDQQYEAGFHRAVLTFHHHRVYDPAKMEMVHLTDVVPSDLDSQLDFLGPYPLLRKYICRQFALKFKLLFEVPLTPWSYCP